ncbi:hypothetical protein [Pantoea dispersa]|uniref:hypothetical protein n=1 Tax=Pantoea dispersa TaxID=59814 RepID=UPI0039BDEFBB
MTEEQRQELIELCEAVLAGHIQYGGDSNEEDIYKIALSALTAEPEVWIKPDSLGLPRLAGIDAVTIPYVPEYPIPLYTAPPAPVLRVPDGWKLVPIVPTEDMVIRGFESKPDPFCSTPEEWAEYEAMSGCQQAAHKATLCWHAMLAAAPEVE